MGNLRVLEEFAELLTFEVISNDTDLGGTAAEGDDITGRVGGSAEDNLPTQEFEDWNGGLARETGGTSEEVFIERHVTDNEDTLVREAGNEFGEGVGHRCVSFSFGLRTCRNGIWYGARGVAHPREPFQQVLLYRALLDGCGEPLHPLDNLILAGGVGEADIPRCPERFAGDGGDVSLIQQVVGQFIAAGANLTVPQGAIE